MRRPGYDGDCWPDDLQTALLRAALCDGDTAASAWHGLRRDFVIDDVWDPEVHRLLPLVHHNLTAAGVEDPDFARMRGIQRRTWFQNQQRIHGIKPVLAQLQAAGVQTLLLKGVPLALTYYEDVGLRPMLDVDVLVPYDSFDRALDLLEQDGWRDLGLDIPRDRRRRMYHGAGMSHPDGRSLDVHWQLALPFVLAHAESESSDDFFRAAVPLSLGDLEVTTLDPADMLLHLVVHGLWSGSEANVRWCADATTVARGAGDALDWDRVLDQTVRRDLVIPVGNGLRFIEDVLDAPVPPAVINELARTPVSGRTRRAYTAILRDPTGPAVLGGLRGTQAYWARQSAKWGPVRAARELPSFLQDNWNLDHPAQVPVEAVRKAVKRVGKVARRERATTQ
ncbi:MAG: hypothetical protein QOF40_1892 [Actinomycetota bacterium]|nr:hypothetical protein [Actinomycetota bacterium]